MASGGKRQGAGRKPSTIKGLVKHLGKFDAEALFVKIKGREKWEELAESDDENVRLKTLIYLTDRAYGKVSQPISGPNDGPIVVRSLNDFYAGLVEKK
jgi:hypothetical protein